MADSSVQDALLVSGLTDVALPTAPAASNTAQNRASTMLGSTCKERNQSVVALNATKECLHTSIEKTFTATPVQLRQIPVQHLAAGLDVTTGATHCRVGGQTTVAT